jgi:hypothetical protein
MAAAVPDHRPHRADFWQKYRGGTTAWQSVDAPCSSAFHARHNLHARPISRIPECRQRVQNGQFFAWPVEKNADGRLIHQPDMSVGNYLRR